MNKYVLSWSAALAVCIAIAVIYSRDVERERARANALEARVFELEPIEKDGSSTGSYLTASGNDSSHSELEPLPEPAIAVPPADDVPAKPRSVMEYGGSLSTRHFVQQLQTSLAAGTPLEEYQIRHLIAAIDEVRGTTGALPITDREAQSTANARIIQLSNEILFESQMDTLIALLNREHHENSAPRQ